MGDRDVNYSYYEDEGESEHREDPTSVRSFVSHVLTLARWGVDDDDNDDYDGDDCGGGGWVVAGGGGGGGGDNNNFVFVVVFVVFDDDDDDDDGVENEENVMKRTITKTTKTMA